VNKEWGRKGTVACFSAGVAFAVKETKIKESKKERKTRALGVMSRLLSNHKQITNGHAPTKGRFTTISKERRTCFLKLLPEGDIEKTTWRAWLVLDQAREKARDCWTLAVRVSGGGSTGVNEVEKDGKEFCFLLLPCRLRRKKRSLLDLCGGSSVV
jgi:hypothetical protein